MTNASRQNLVELILAFLCKIHTGAYKAPRNRPGVVRSYIKAIVPIEISDVNGSLTRSTQIISKIVIKEALIEAVERKVFVPEET